MIEKILGIIVAGCLTAYWGAVVVKLIKLARKIGKDPNVLPRERVGQLMRVLWYPAIVLMIAYAWVATFKSSQGGVWTTRWMGAETAGWAAAAGVATGLCVAGTVATFVCWRKMGRSWRIGIDPKEKLELVSTGPYRFVRHPIYAIRMVMDVCAIVVFPTWLMVLAAGLDFLLLQVEARREENYMESKHGGTYAAYKKSVGRFVPRSFVG